MVPSSSGHKVDIILKNIKNDYSSCRDDPFDQDYHLITWVKGVTGNPAGGTPSRQSGCRRSPGGECFAPLGSKGRPDCRQEEPPLTTLAATCHREENASHHYAFAAVFWFTLLAETRGLKGRGCGLGMSHHIPPLGLHTCSPPPAGELSFHLVNPRRGVCWGLPFPNTCMDS